MKIGLDVHGVIDAYPEKFSKFAKKMLDLGFMRYTLLLDRKKKMWSL